MAHILVIDDEESILFTFYRFLSTEEHEVRTADCYTAALARLDEEHFDLILADINLGDGWGIDILHEVARRGLATRVIIMTAYPSNETRAVSLSQHASDYLVKPLRQEILVRSVDNALQLMEQQAMAPSNRPTVQPSNRPTVQPSSRGSWS